MVAVGVPHHITQRGNNRQTVFLTDADRLFYLDTLRLKCREHGLDVLGWCLMPNHVHLVAVPTRDDSMAKAVGQTHHRFALRSNRLRRRSGHLWQNRFYSCPVGQSHLVETLAYVDLNPVRARLVDRPGAYNWSSASAHLAGRDPSGLLDDWRWSEIDPGREWAEVLAARPAAARFRRRLARCLSTGLPLGGDALIPSQPPAAQAATSSR